MTAEQLNKLARHWLCHMDIWGIAAIDPPEGFLAAKGNIPNCAALGHAKWMLERVRDMDDPIKKRAWIAFAEAVLWQNGLVSINALREAVIACKAGPEAGRP